ncbi:MAG: hypothetical protein MJ230_05585 [bacterium]|nr:hypothetical protein [bacterium]
MADYINPVGIPSMSPMDYAYFAQAMQTPVGAYQMQYPYNVAFKGGSNISSAGTTASTPATSNASAPVAEKKSNAGLVLGGILTVGATALCIAGHRRGPATEQGLKRTWEGIKTIFGKGAQQEQATLRMMNSQKVVTIPGRKNIMPNGDGLASIGLSAPDAKSLIKGGIETPGLLNEGNELRSFVFDIENDSKQITHKVVWNNKNGYTVIKDGKKLDNVDDNMSERITNYIEEVLNGKVDLSNLEKVCIRNTNKETGLVSNFIMKNGTPELKSCVSQYFPVDMNNPYIIRECKVNPGFKNALEVFSKGSAKDINKLQLADGATVNLRSLNISSNGYTIKGCEVDKNGNILKLIMEKDGKCTTLNNSTAVYENIMAVNEEKIAKIINAKDRKNWENLVYLAA